LTKPYLKSYLLKLISITFSSCERFACARFDTVIEATPSIRDKFLKINSKSV